MGYLLSAVTSVVAPATMNFFQANAPYVTIFMIAVMIGLFIWDKLPNYVVGFGVAAILVGMGVITPTALFAGFTNSTTLVILFMGPVGEALISSGAGGAFGNALVRYSKGNERLLLLLVMIAAAILSAVAPNTAAVLALLPITMAMAKAFKIDPRRLLLPLVAAASLGGLLTMIGSAPNLLANSVAKSNNILPFGFFEYGKVGVFICIVGITFVMWFQKRINKKMDQTNAKHAELISKEDTEVEGIQSKFRAWASVAILVATAVCMVALDEKLLPTIALVGALLTVVTRCMTGKQFINAVSWDAVLLFGSLISLGTAMSVKGADGFGGAELIANQTVALFGSASPVVLLAVLYFLAGTLSQFMSNTATVGIVAPIAVMIAANAGINPQAILMAVTLAAGMAFATPLATPPCVIIASKVHITMKEFARLGVPSFLISMVVAVIFFPIMFPMADQKPTFNMFNEKTQKNIIINVNTADNDLLGITDPNGTIPADAYTITVNAKKENFKILTIKKEYLAKYKEGDVLNYKIDMKNTDTAADPNLTITMVKTEPVAK